MSHTGSLEVLRTKTKEYNSAINNVTMAPHVEDQSTVDVPTVVPGEREPDFHDTSSDTLDNGSNASPTSKVERAPSNW